MRLFLITRSDETDWDEYNAALVRADDAFDAARFVLLGENAPEGTSFHGFTEHNIVVTPVTSAGVHGLIIADFKAG
jgi:hypothetical protein